MRFGKALFDSKRLMNDVGVTSGMHVADFGCGRSGHISLPASEIVGPDGRVYAVDLVKDHLETLNNLSSMRGIHNFEPSWGDIERYGGVAIPDDSLDRVFFVNNLSLLQGREGFVNELGRVLNNQGQLVVVDWKKSYSHPVAPVSDRLMDIHDAELLFTRLGLRKVDEVPVSSSHWGLVFA